MEDRARFRNPLARVAFVVLGLLALGLGITGFIVPGLPGTVFLLIAAWMFSLSNERLYNWMLTNRWFGSTLADYRAGLGMPRKIKIIAISSMTVVVPLSVTFGLHELWLRLLVAGLGIFGVAFVATRPTRELVEAER